MWYRLRHHKERSMRQSRTYLFTLTIILLTVVGISAQTTRQINYPTPVEGDYVAKDFKFKSGETLPEVKLHYRTIGSPSKDRFRRRDQATRRRGARSWSATWGGPCQVNLRTWGGPCQVRRASLTRLAPHPRASRLKSRAPGAFSRRWPGRPTGSR